MLTVDAPVRNSRGLSSVCAIAQALRITVGRGAQDGVPSARRTLRAGLHARVSTTDQVPENQLAVLRTFAEARGWAATEYADDGVSGGRTSRPALDPLLAAARARRLDVVLITKVGTPSKRDVVAGGFSPFATGGSAAPAVPPAAKWLCLRATIAGTTVALDRPEWPAAPAGADHGGSHGNLPLRRSPGRDVLLRTVLHLRLAPSPRRPPLRAARPRRRRARVWLGSILLAAGHRLLASVPAPRAPA